MFKFGGQIFHGVQISENKIYIQLGKKIIIKLLKLILLFFFYYLWVDFERMNIRKTNVGGRGCINKT